MAITELAVRLARCERRKRWVDGMGGLDSPRYRALYREAYDLAGPDGLSDYLNMAQQIDEGHAAHKTALAFAVRAEAARRAGAAAAAVLQRATEIQLAVRSAAEDLHLTDADFSTRAPMGAAEAASELRVMLGLANRMPSAYRAQLPDVGDLARMIGVKR
jgi:hypothetical protein